MSPTKDSNENELQYIWRMCSAKDSGLLEMTWQELAKVLNENLFSDESEYLGESAFRKKYQYAKDFYEQVFSKMTSNEYSDDLISIKRELEMSKIKYRDERNAWNKQNYIQARFEQKMDYLEEMLSEMGKINFDYSPTPNINSDNDMLILLSDLHIGQTFQSAWGQYNTGIAKRRLNQYLGEITRIRSVHNSENAYVTILGDLISGSIHKSVQVSNRENVIEQIKIAAEIISSFCYELSKIFKNVIITNVSGNHSRLESKDDALHDERLDDLIGWIISKSLSHISNIEFEDFNIDIGIAEMNIRGRRYVSCHGDYDQFTKNGVANLSMMLGYIPDVICFGHLHHFSMDDINGVKLVRGGSLAGSGDSYTIEKRLTGSPTQTICVCTEDGIECCYPIELD